VSLVRAVTPVLDERKAECGRILAERVCGARRINAFRLVNLAAACGL
jgi:hypothetical protein